jgi:hypothetical protein
MSSRKSAAATPVSKSRTPEPGDGFWAQWPSTSMKDLVRDTYGTRRRHELEDELRPGAKSARLGDTRAADA